MATGNAQLSCGASGEPTRGKRSFLLVLVGVVAVSAGAFWFLSRDSYEGGYRVGSALDSGIQSGLEVTSPHTQVGKEYWVALPTADNVSDRPLTLLRGEITQVPEGLEVVGYKAISHEDTDGHPLSASPVEGSPGVPKLTKLPDHSSRPSLVPAHEPGDVFWAARVRVTGKVTGDLTGCRYYYRQDGTEYGQNVACTSRIRLGPALD
ncbi:hypothetical protein [Streptomyces sp. XY006]|uniref:hypothetical protein n=1 Tax=Streptomyces sp. XY006 TaxID=2021410 RepID=UPI000B8C24A2|nr:hypothetical protein [Streptomyces sp. XY006]OXS37056.1 hypothetical protein CHR28_00700 [Streptomyces sp. XY006]